MSYIPSKEDLEQFKTRLGEYLWKGNGSKYRTQALFLDQVGMKPEEALYSLQPWDREKNGIYYPSIHRLFVEMNDPAEFEFANTYMGGYQHWLTVKASPFFKPHYASMVEELNAKLSSKSIKSMINQMEDGTASQATLKYLADKDYLGKNPVGKPKRRKPKGEVVSLVKSDLERMKR